jgi:hypothetical protein
MLHKCQRSRPKSGIRQSSLIEHIQFCAVMAFLGFSFRGSLQLQPNRMCKVSVVKSASVGYGTLPGKLQLFHCYDKKSECFLTAISTPTVEQLELIMLCLLEITLGNQASYSPAPPRKVA